MARPPPASQHNFSLSVFPACSSHFSSETGQSTISAQSTIRKPQNAENKRRLQNTDTDERPIGASNSVDATTSPQARLPRPTFSCPSRHALRRRHNMQTEGFEQPLCCLTPRLSGCPIHAVLASIHDIRSQCQIRACISLIV
jgi:hypothetical protein